MNTSDNWSEYYRTSKDFGVIPTSLLNKILSECDTSLPKTCVDLGCGTGRLTRDLYHHGYDCVGLDGSSEAIAIAKHATIRKNLVYAQFDLEKDFNDCPLLLGNVFSLVTCKLVVAFIKNKPKFIQQIGALLHQEGTLIIVTPTHKTPEEETPISVDFDSILRLLKRDFPNTIHFQTLHTLSYFICKKESKS